MLTNQIKSDVLGVLEHFVDSPASFDFEKYESRKSSFYAEWGNRLIYTQPDIKIEVSRRQQENLLRDFFYTLPNSILNKPMFISFLWDNGTDGFMQNKITQNFYLKMSEADIPTELSLEPFQDKHIKIQAGMKLTRAFKYFIDTGYALNSAQTRYSQIVNSSRAEGDLSLSIHPLDYLSMSHNNAGWRSCQSPDGEYAAGMLSLMSDRSTIVAYLASPELEVLGWGGPHWNSKKWRILIHIDETRNKIVFSKHYPYHSDDLELKVVEILKKIYPQFNDVDLEPLESASDVIASARGSSSYNDISRGSNFTAHQLSTGESFKKIIVGAKVNCVHCGENPIEDSMAFACYHCSPVETFQCENCGDDGFNDDSIVWVESEGINICPDCYHDSYATCNCCWSVVQQHDLSEDQATCQSCSTQTILEENTINESSG